MEHQAVTIVIGTAARNGTVRPPDNDWRSRPSALSAENGASVGQGVTVVLDSDGNNTWIPLAWGLLSVAAAMLLAYLFKSASIRTMCQ